MIRLDKYLADMGIGTRSEVKNIIRKKQVSVNGIPISKPETKVDITKDTVCYQGKPVAYEPYVYYMLNKPCGCVSAVKDNLYPTVLSFIENPKGYDLFPVGRLDFDTEGLLLITNDGTLAHELLSPKKHVTKTYFGKGAGKSYHRGCKAFFPRIRISKKRNRHFLQPLLLKNRMIFQKSVSASQKGNIIRSNVCLKLSENRFFFKTAFYGNVTIR